MAARWLEGKRARCKLVLVEPRTAYGGEEPDAVGWTGRGRSIMVECKVSRADFLSDRRKRCRGRYAGVGERRYYLAPRVVCTLADLPEGWGLLRPSGSGLRVEREATPRAAYDHRHEARLLVQAVRKSSGWQTRI
jgi:hypothetical protein